MYAVIFRAEINEVDEVYAEMAAKLRMLAREKYGCADFVSATAGNCEISISYWDTVAQIEQWRQDGEHLVAQRLGRSKWYKSYHVQVVEIIREYCT